MDMWMKEWMEGNTGIQMNELIVELWQMNE